MNSGFIWLASLLAFPIAGSPLLLHPSYRRYGVPARLVFASAAGAYACVLAMTLASLAGWRWRLPGVVAAGAGLCLLLRLLLPALSDRDERPAGGRLRALEWAAIAVIVFALGAAAAAALSAAATAPDLLAFWGPKAEAFASARGLDVEYLGDPIHIYQHVSYPPLVPAVYAFGTIAAGRFPWMAPVATFPLLLAALALALPGTLSRFAGRRDALVATAMIVSSLGFLGDALDVAGNADSALLLFEVLSVGLLMGAAAGDAPAELLGGILLGAAVAAKVEGLPFALSAAALLLFLRRRQGLAALARTGVRLAGPSAAMLGAWLAFGATRGLFHGYESYGPLLRIHWDAVGLALRTLGLSLRDAGWALPWAIPLVALLATGRRAARQNALYPAAIAATLAAFFVFTYVHLADPTLLIVWSAGRIFMIVSSLLVLAVVGARASAAPGSAQPPAR